MGELLDRDFQREILTDLKHEYPRALELKHKYGIQLDNRILVNLSYLDEYGLVKLKTYSSLDGPLPLTAQITARGMDFLADDGGLSAILNVVTVKLHEDTIKQLIIDRINSSDASNSVKDSLVTKIKSLPAEALSAVIQKALDAGLESLPNLPNLMETWLKL